VIGRVKQQTASFHVFEFSVNNNQQGSKMRYIASTKRALVAET
jgi:hypothetical protein